MRVMKFSIAEAFLAIPAMALAQNGPPKKSTLDKLQNEMTVCIAYYSTAKNCLGDNDPAAKRLDGMVDRLTGRSFSIGKSIGMSSDGMLARLRSALGEQSKVIENSCDNIAKLHQAHGGRCKLVVENPNAVYDEIAKP
jgi:hypothetical protein